MKFMESNTICMWVGFPSVTGRNLSLFTWAIGLHRAFRKADYTLWNMEWNIVWNIGYQTSVMSQELHFYHKTVTVLDLYTTRISICIQSLHLSRHLATVEKYVLWLCSTCSWQVQQLFREHFYRSLLGVEMNAYR